MRYDIVRFFQDDRPSEIIEEDVSLEEAQAHCNDPETSGEGWFDGFQKSGTPLGWNAPRETCHETCQDLCCKPQRT